MKHNYYVVSFKNGMTVFANTFNESEAVILAQAVMIKNAFTYEVESVRETRYIDDAKLTDFYAQRWDFTGCFVRRWVTVANVSDGYLEDYIDNKFDYFDNSEDIEDLAMEIIDYVKDAKSRRLKEMLISK